MDKKELILTVAKDLLCAYQIKKEEFKAENKVDGIADLLERMAKKVEKVYKEIGD